MVQFLSINFFSWISSIFVGVFKSSRFFVSTCITLPSTPGSPKWSLSFRFPHQNPVYSSPLPIRATCPVHLILIDFIIRTVLCEQFVITFAFLKYQLVKLPVFITSSCRHICRELGQDVAQTYVTQCDMCCVPSKVSVPFFASLVQEPSPPGSRSSLRVTPLTSRCLTACNMTDHLRHNFAAADGSGCIVVSRLQKGKEQRAWQVDVKILTDAFARSRQKRVLAASCTSVLSVCLHVSVPLQLDGFLLNLILGGSAENCRENSNLVKIGKKNIGRFT